MRIEWRDIPGYEGKYLVSNTGVVRSIDRIVYCEYEDMVVKKKFPSVVLKPAFTHKKYFKVTLSKDNKRKLCFIHRLMLLAFIPNSNNLPQCNHKNGIRHCNKLSNLEWVTAKENSSRAWFIKRKKEPQND